MKNIRRISAMGAAAAMLGGLAMVGGGATVAQADTRCDWSSVYINGNPGAESGSWASGHGHRTGNHYVGAYANGLVDWYADNNGGDDGDTWDSYYGTRAC